MGRRVERLAWVLAGIAVVSTLYLLPVEPAVLRLEAEVEALGPAGPWVYALSYAALSLLFVPASVLGIGAGAVLGPWLGGLAVFAGGMIAASVGFGVGRALGRARLMALFEGRRAWLVVDQAVGHEGVKVVAAVRLLPVIPFSASNYLFGVTGIHFRVYLATSAVALLPGMATYVGLGAFGRFGLAQAFDDRLGILLLLGLLLGLLVIRSVVRWALRTFDAAGSGLFRPSARPPRPGRALVTLGLATVAWLYAFDHRVMLASALGPPVVHGVERHPKEGRRFDHADYQALLERYVDDAGNVDYPGLATEGASALSSYLDRLAGADFDGLARDEKLAFLLNAYNAATLRLVVAHWPVRSILDVPRERRFQGTTFVIGRRPVTLDELEHGWIRREFEEPRVHFGLVCASRGCPPLPRFAFRGEQLLDQLTQVTGRVHQDPRYCALSPDGKVLRLTRLYDWYRTDLTVGAGALLSAVADRAPAVAQALAAGHHPRIEWAPWDWSLNLGGPLPPAPPAPPAPAPAPDAPPPESP